MIVIENIFRLNVDFLNIALLVKKELENAYKMIKYLQNDNTTIKSRSDPAVYLDKSLLFQKTVILFDFIFFRISSMEGELKLTKLELESIKKEFKNLDKIQKSTERMIQNSKLQEEESFGKKVFSPI